MPLPLMTDLSPTGIMLIGSVLLFVSIAVSKAGYKFGVPVLLLFLFVGMAFGSDGLGLLEFTNVKAAQFIGMVALSIILFSGGMDTQIKDIKPVLKQGIMLSTVGVLMMALVTGFFIWWISGLPITNVWLPLSTSLLLAAAMSSTDSASVFSVLRTQKIGLKHNLKPLLELESGSNDPMAYMLVVMLIQVIQSSSVSGWAIAWAFVVQFLLGGGIGYSAGKLAVIIINKIRVANEALYSILLLSFIFAIFAITDMLGGNGYLAVYIAGVVVGNSRIVYKKDIATFLDGTTWLVQIIMFLTLGLLVNTREMLDVALIATLIGLFMIFVARPLSVYLSLLPFRKMSGRCKVFISWVGLRGAVPIIFATYPVVAQVEGSNVIFNIVFFITILSLLVQGTTITFMARKLGLTKPLKRVRTDFGVEIPEDIDVDLRDIVITKRMIDRRGSRLSDMHVDSGILVVIIKRGRKHFVPNGEFVLKPGDKLLVMSERRDDLP